MERYGYSINGIRSAQKRHIIHCSKTTSINYLVDMHINYLRFFLLCNLNGNGCETFSLHLFNKHSQTGMRSSITQSPDGTINACNIELLSPRQLQKKNEFTSIYFTNYRNNFSSGVGKFMWNMTIKSVIRKCMSAALFRRHVTTTLQWDIEVRRITASMFYVIKGYKTISSQLYRTFVVKSTASCLWIGR